MAGINDSTIREALTNVNDPDLGQNIVDLDFISNIDINNNSLTVDLEITGPAHIAAEKIQTDCVNVLKDYAADLKITVNVTEKPFEKKGNGPLDGVKNIIAIASGKGGVGKSAVSSNLAAALSLTGAKVGILDGDIYGPSQPTMFGLNDASLQAIQDENGKNIAFPADKYGIKVASMGFIINRDEAAIVRGPMLAGYFSMLFEQVHWGDLDYLIFDLPPGTGDIQLTLTQKIPLTGSVIVTTPQEISVADVRRSIAMFKRVNVDIMGVIENMSYFVPPDMPDKKYYIFGEGGGRKEADEKGINFLGEIPLFMGFRESNDNGMPYVLREDAGHHGEVIKEIAAKMVSETRKKNHGGAEDLDIEL